MLWRCICSQRVRRLDFIDSIVTAEKYKLISEQELLPSCETLRLANGDFIFQQDHLPYGQKWLEEHNISLLPWPSSRPDLSPIETLWYEMKKALRIAAVKTIPHLKAKLLVIWNSFTSEYFTKLVDTIQRRTDAVIKRRGDCMQW